MFFLAKFIEVGVVDKIYIFMYKYEHLHQNILIGISFLIRLRNLIIKIKYLPIYLYIFGTCKKKLRETKRLEIYVHIIHEILYFPKSN